MNIKCWFGYHDWNRIETIEWQSKDYKERILLVGYDECINCLAKSRILTFTRLSGKLYVERQKGW